MQSNSTAVYRLPVETLTDIFRCAQDQDPFFSVTLDRRERLFTQVQGISGTCSAWRQVVYSNPIFWSSFDLHLECMSDVEQSNFLVACLSRSGTAKLRLSITFQRTRQGLHTSDQLQTGQFAVIDYLFDQASRWRDVYLDIAPEIFADTIMNLNLGAKPVHGYFPNLERLDCIDQESTMCYYREPGSDRSLFHIFYPCPALKHLSTHDAWNGDPFDCSHLTSLELLYYRGNSLSSLLSRCPLLQRFSIAKCSIPQIGETDYEDPSRWSDSNPFCHPNITALSLPMYDRNFGSEIWADVRFPSLDTLDIDQVKEDEIPALLAMLRKSECILRTMKLGKMHWEVFEELLSVAPSIRFLTLGSHYTDYSCIHEPNQMLAPLFGTATRVPVPNLSCLMVEFFPESFNVKRYRIRSNDSSDNDSDAMSDATEDPETTMADMEDTQEDNAKNTTEDFMEDATEEAVIDDAMADAMAEHFRCMLVSRRYKDPRSIRIKVEHNECIEAWSSFDETVLPGLFLAFMETTPKTKKESKRDYIITLEFNLDSGS
ncbi:hypothetical protein F5890DRAFT_1274841 [Lentinula detonsa]|uniref:F-box domain-containing protein n=1 Tax=Lentinula detonsa TaxID=2804962 RepID=A0AA38PZ65_9AGAR|nr:hypothetical protein F5890DRAFT_1274841 [Lentinula detonsa]